MTGTYSSDREHFQVSLIWTGTRHSQRMRMICEVFMSSLRSDPAPSILFQPLGKIQRRQQQQQCFDYTVTTQYEEVSEPYNLLFFSLFLFFFFFTEGTRESRRTLNIAIRQLGSPSPASGRLCPLFRDRAELRWWPPRELHLCRPRRQR